MKEPILFEQENLYQKNVNNLITQFKSDILIKALNLYLNSNYRDSEIVLLTEFPENSFNDDSLVQYLMGHIKLKLEEYESALNYFCHALKNEVNHIPLIYDSRGLTCLYQRDYNSAIRNFKEACSYSQNNYHYHNHLALCYQIVFNIQKTKTEKILSVSKNNKFYSEKSNEESNSISESKYKSNSINSSNIESSDNEKEKERRREKDRRRLRRMTDSNNKIKNKIKEAYQYAININPNSYISLINLGTCYAND